MKKTALLFYFLYLTGLGANAQHTFASPGAEWWYSSFSSFGNEGLYFLLHAKVTGDTLINGQSCSIIQQNGTEKRISGQQWSPETQTNLRSFYVYSNSDTAFIYNELFGKFTPLYIYNVTEGQTICLPVINDINGRLGGWPMQELHPMTGDSSFCYVVDSIRMVRYDTSLLKTVYTHAVFDPLDLDPFPSYPVQNWSHTGYGSQGAYIEKIGGWRGGLLPKPLYFTGLFDGMEPTQFLNMNCYSDNNTSIRLSATACDSLPPTTLSIKDRSPITFAGSVFPNPARDYITIRPEAPFKKGTTYALFDISGRKLLSGELPAGKAEAAIALAQLTAGIYYLLFSSELGKCYQKISLWP